MMHVQNLTPDGLVGVLKFYCTIAAERDYYGVSHFVRTFPKRLAGGHNQPR